MDNYMDFEYDKIFIKHMESLSCKEILSYLDSRDFENFKSNICHLIKSLGDLRFLVLILKKDIIRYCFMNKHFLECYYFLGLSDYICHNNKLPLDNEYNDIRKYKMSEMVFPGGVNVLCCIFGNEEPKKEALEKAIPEFLLYNIVEWGIENVA